MNTKEYLAMTYATAGVTPSLDELDRWSKRYSAARASAELLYAMPEAKYEDLAVVFTPTV